jgi:hypothetical protein
MGVERAPTIPTIIFRIFLELSENLLAVFLEGFPMRFHVKCLPLFLWELCGGKLADFAYWQLVGEEVVWIFFYERDQI